MVFRTLHDLDRTAGTVRLVEVGSAHVVHKAGTDIVLVPQPSSDPNDPLRLPQWRKNVAFSILCTFIFLVNFAIGGLAPAFLVLSEEFDKSIPVTAYLLTYCILCLGLGNFFWVPSAIYFGKRPVFVLASGLFFAFTLWTAVATSYETLFAARIISALAGGSTEALGAAIVNDIYYLHERGSKMGIYMVALSTGNAIGPLISGFTVTAIGWRWFNWIATILCGITFVAVVFFVPETRFERQYDRGIAESEDGQEGESKTAAVEVEHVDSHADASIPARKSYWKQLSLWSGVPSDTNFFAIFFRPFPLIIYPAVLWGVLSYAMSLVAVVAVNDLNSFVYQVAPYNFTAAINGLINIPSLIGNLFGCFTSGYLLDRFAEWRARRNDGIFVPESRLPLVVIPGVLVPVGTLLFGFAAEEKMHWAVGYVGYGLVAIGLSATANIAMIYVMDSYYPVAAEALLLVNGFKNVVAFGFLHGIVTWVGESGYEAAFGTLAGLYIAIIGLAIPLYYFGARIRRHTSSQWKLINWAL
ncbi:hypothetical protein SEUCBS140593_003400 [Sporothrix eucalyptigena]|uniref:Major facilitator superfamily (MFS) profile domain-containing protein n=1 Tax=Sporothrix eucalyptigena TaxID=1812306 RepID=A0ABP0BFU6_9PEZI